MTEFCKNCGQNPAKLVVKDGDKIQGFEHDGGVWTTREIAPAVGENPGEFYFYITKEMAETILYLLSEATRVRVEAGGGSTDMDGVIIRGNFDQLINDFIEFHGVSGVTSVEIPVGECEDLIGLIKAFKNAAKTLGELPIQASND